MATLASTVFVGSYASPKLPSANFTYPQNVRQDYRGKENACRKIHLPEMRYTKVPTTIEGVEEM